jgi:AcrR family transcriptional regulator
MHFAMMENKSDARRAAIIERLADHVLQHGLIAASLRPLAKAAGTSDRMLLYYFSDKAEIIGATLQHIAARMTGILVERAAPVPLPLEPLTRHLTAMVLDQQLWPYMCVWLELASRAGRGDPLYVPIASAIGAGFLAWGEAQLDSANPEVRAREAAQLLIRVEGAVMIKAIGMEAAVVRATA